MTSERTARGEVQSDPQYRAVLSSTPRIGDVWTYRSRAIVPSRQDEETVRFELIADARRALPEELATIELLSIRRTPTGRWSAMVKRTRIALELPA